MELNDLISFAALVVSVITFISTYIHQRQQATLEAFSDFQKDVLDELYTFSKGQVSEIANSNARSPDYKHLSVLLARCEHFAVLLYCSKRRKHNSTDQTVL